MEESELARHAGDMVIFRCGGAQHRGRLMQVGSAVWNGSDQEGHVLVEPPATLVKLSVPSRDVTLVESNNPARVALPEPKKTWRGDRAGPAEPAPCGRGDRIRSRLVLGRSYDVLAWNRTVAKLFSDVSAGRVSSSVR